MTETQNSNLGQQQAIETTPIESTPDLRQQNRQRIEFELRRIANDLNDSQGIQSLDDLQEVARFSDAIDYRLIAELNPLLLDGNLSSDDIATFIDNNSITLESSLRELRKIGNQLQISNQEEVRAIAQLQEVSITIDESEFSDLEGKVTSIGRNADTLATSNEALAVVLNADVQRYSGLEGMQRYAEDQDALSQTETQYYYTHELIANTYQNDSPNCLTNQYDGVCGQIAELSETMQSIGLINLGNRNVVEMAEQRRETLNSSRDRLLSTLTRFRNQEGPRAKQNAEAARASLNAARNNISRILDQKINQEIDAGIITVQEAREMARASLETSRDGIDTHFAEVRQRILNEKELINTEISDIQGEKARLSDQGSMINQQSSEVTDNSEIAKRRLISSIVNACATFGMGENQLREIVDNTPDLQLSEEEKGSLYSLLRSRIPDADAQATFGSRSETYVYNLRQSLYNLERVGNLGSETNERVDANNNQNFDQISTLDQREQSLRDRLNGLNLSLTELESNRESALTELENQLTELNLQLNQVEVGMQDSMRLMYEAQGLNDLANEGFSNNAEALNTRTTQVFSGADTMQQSLDEYEVPEMPWLATRYIRTAYTPTRLVLEGANNLLGSAITGVEMGAVMAAYGYTQLRGINTIPFSQAMEGYENYEEVFSRSLTDHIGNASSNISQFNRYLFENYNYRTAVIRPFTAGFSAIIAGLGGLGNVIIRPDTFFTGTYRILTNFPTSIAEFGKAVFHAEHIESGDLASWIGAVGGEILLIAYGPSVVAIGAKGIGSLARATSRIGRTARKVSTHSATGIAEADVIFSANTNFNPLNNMPQIIDRVLITNARINESSSDDTENASEQVSRLDSGEVQSEQLALNTLENSDNNTRRI